LCEDWSSLIETQEINTVEHTFELVVFLLEFELASCYRVRPFSFCSEMKKVRLPRGEANRSMSKSLRQQHAFTA